VRRQLCVFRNNSINDNSISGNKRLISTCASTTDRPPDRPTDQSLHRPIDLFKAYCCRHPTDECLAACLTASPPARPPACLAPCLPACLPAHAYMLPWEKDPPDPDPDRLSSCLLLHVCSPHQSAVSASKSVALSSSPSPHVSQKKKKKKKKKKQYRGLTVLLINTHRFPNTNTNRQAIANPTLLRATR
jgi:hypothetical protein